MGQLTPPATVADFKAQFTRDFNYGVGMDTVRDADIQSALNRASSIFNPALFDTTPVGVLPNVTSEAKICYLNASAHFLVIAIQGVGGLSASGPARSPGLASQGEGVVTSKSAGGVSIGSSFPDAIANNPVLFGLTKTTYGLEYLQVLMTRLVGNVAVVAGETVDPDAVS